jgi:hypothetical protein
VERQAKQARARCTGDFRGVIAGIVVNHDDIETEFPDCCDHSSDVCRFVAGRNNH